MKNLKIYSKKKLSNKYVTIFFGILKNKNNKKLKYQFVAKKKIGKCCKKK